MNTSTVCCLLFHKNIIGNCIQYAAMLLHCCIWNSGIHPGNNYLAFHFITVFFLRSNLV